jgi:hypothetical protein
VLVWLVAVLASVAVAATSPAGAPRGLTSGHVTKTEVVRWSPFNSASELKPQLAVKTLPKGDCPAADSEEIGFAYRCTSRDLLLDPCWPDGANPTQFAICAADPWFRTVYRVPDPQLLLEAGVMFGKVGEGPPWGIELEDGNRCLLAHGAHDVAPTPKGELVVDYYCRHGLALLTDLRRGRVWKIAASRYAHGRYRFLGDRKIRRAYLGGLPPALERENVIARSAIAPASRAVRREHPNISRHSLQGVDRVRLTLPDGLWARVEFFTFGEKDAGAVLRSVAGRWVETLDYQPYCHKLRPDVRVQLFTPRECPPG